MSSFAHLRMMPPCLIEREGLFLLDFFHIPSKSAVFDEFLNPLEGLDVEQNPDPSAIVSYDIPPFDIDRHMSVTPAAVLRFRMGVLAEQNDKTLRGAAPLL